LAALSEALGASGWSVQEVDVLPAAADTPGLGLIWCPERTDLERLLPKDRRPVLPTLLVSPPPSEAQRRAALARGLWQWLPEGTSPAQVHAALLWLADLVAAQAERERALQAQLDERKWTERAKGLLMQARGIDEPTAFALLRDTAMQTQTRLPVVAREVVGTTELAEALERAGAQRMLSQRLVKLQALKQWAPLALAERREAQALQDASAERVRANLARLAELLREELQAERAAVATAWAALSQALDERVPDLTRSDVAAQQLLDSSEALVQGLRERAGQRPVALLAQVTRLRLLSQRLAKEGLLAQLDPRRDAAGVAAGLDEFTQAYEQVRAAPLAGPALQPAFAAVDEAWLVLLRGLRAEPGEAVQRLHQGSERLLQALEQLTQALQSSLQLILG
jgi:hypothetical protein